MIVEIQFVAAVIFINVLVSLTVIKYFVKRAKLARTECRKMLHLKKSSETRIGLVGEQLSPYLDEWPFDDPREFRLISSPIDGINFGKDEIALVEIKTGKSRLSKNQKRIRELVRQGKVSYIEFRVNEDGCQAIKTEIKK